MNCELSVQELAEYRTNGFVVRRSVFQRRELGALRSAADIAVATAQQLSVVWPPNSIIRWSSVCRHWPCNRAV
ncbi:MAG: hypothetical protein CM15mP120_19710 [Pseudomonadota bacterium]|nr:MAG: hypothetical protein CM15mP120_19710 [Pseudomonadota bacterium]